MGWGRNSFVWVRRFVLCVRVCFCWPIQIISMTQVSVNSQKPHSTVSGHLFFRSLLSKLLMMRWWWSLVRINLKTSFMSVCSYLKMMKKKFLISEWVRVFDDLTRSSFIVQMPLFFRTCDFPPLIEWIPTFSFLLKESREQATNESFPPARISCLTQDGKARLVCSGWRRPPQPSKMMMGLARTVCSSPPRRALLWLKEG